MMHFQLRGLDEFRERKPGSSNAKAIIAKPPGGSFWHHDIQKAELTSAGGGPFALR